MAFRIGNGVEYTTQSLSISGWSGVYCGWLVQTNNTTHFQMPWTTNQNTECPKYSVV